MTQAVPPLTKIPTTQPREGHPPASPEDSRERTGRGATRGGGEVIELEYGITVYPARERQGRWRAVWHDDGERQQCEAAS
jgi:hypothetical protein